MLTARPTVKFTLAALAAVVLTACGGGGGDEGSAPADPAASSSDASPAGTLAPTDFTVPPSSVVEAEPIVELPTDERIELGSIESVRQELSAECTEAVAPIRQLMETYTTGVGLPDDAKTTLNDGLAAGRGACEQAEWADFQSLELHGWMYAAG